MFERLKAELTLDSSGFKAGVKDAKSEMGGLSSKASSMGRSMQKAGGLMTAGITAPIAALGYQSLQAASDAEEMQSKMNVVFGDLTGDIEDWSESHANEVNRSKYQLQEYATSLQDTFVPMGMARDEAADMSTEMSELAVDLASFNNMAEDDAVRRLQSGIVGNHEALREFGVMISQSRLDEQLQEMFGTSASEATEAQKAQARYQLILQDTEDAQGDAARTSGSFANQVKGLKAQIQELKIGIGRELLPYAKVLVGYLSTLATGFGNLSERQQKIIIIIAGVAAVLGPLLLLFGTLLTMLPAMAAGFGILAGAVSLPLLPLLAIVAALGVLAYAWTNDWGGIQGKTKKAASFVTDKLKGLASYLRNDFPTSAADARSNFNDNMDRLQKGSVNSLKRLDKLSGGRLSKWKDKVIGHASTAKTESLAIFDDLRSGGGKNLSNAVDQWSDIFYKWHPVGIIWKHRKRIMNALPSASDFYSRGKALIRGFTNGIKSLASRPAKAVKKIAKRVRDKLPFSPAKEGPLADLDETGPALVEELASGMEGSLARAEGASSRVADAASPNPEARAGATGAPRDAPQTVIDLGSIPEDAWVRVGDLKDAVMEEVKDREETRTDQISYGSDFA